LNALEIKSHECVLVGDSVKDVSAALQLNVLTVGMTTGISTKEELIYAGAHYLASSITDVPILITQLDK
jgi:phosphoglycolate phosphatase-like HAD superfamily hydrolase